MTLRIGLFLFGLVLVGLAFHTVKDLGKQEERAERAREVKRRLDNATIADDAATRCLADPRCRLQSDGFRRD